MIHEAPTEVATSFLAREMVHADEQLKVVCALGYVEAAEKLMDYREVVRMLRSAILRGEAYPEWAACRYCNKVIDRDVFDLGQRCPWCEEYQLRRADVRT